MGSQRVGHDLATEQQQTTTGKSETIADKPDHTAPYFSVKESHWYDWYDYKEWEVKINFRQETWTSLNNNLVGIEREVGHLLDEDI